MIKPEGSTQSSPNRKQNKKHMGQPAVLKVSPGGRTFLKKKSTLNKQAEESLLFNVKH